MNLLQSHIDRYPNARASTLVRLLKVEKMAARLEAEYLAAEERRVEKLLMVCLRTLPINCRRAEKTGRW